MTKRFFSILLLVVVGAIIAGCSGGDSSNASSGDSEVVELEFWTFWGGGARNELIEGLVEDFNESQDEIKVDHLFVPWDDIWTKNLAQIAAGNPPDVIVNDIRTVSQRAEKNQNTNLSEYVDEEMKDSFFPNQWETVVHEGEPYALPFTTDTRLLYYNKDLFEEVGLDPEQPPTTWQELEEYAAKLDKKEGDRYEQIGFYPLYGNSGPDVWLTSGDGGRHYTDENGDAFINTPEKVEALEWLRGWSEKYGQRNVDDFQANFNGGGSDPFLMGQLGMMVHTGTYYSDVLEVAPDMNIGVAPIPEKEPGSGHWSQGGGFVMEIPYGAKHPEASFEFIKYLTSEEVQKKYAVETFDNIAHIEASQQAIEELSGQQKDVYALTVENLDSTVLWMPPLELPRPEDIVNPLVEQAVRGDLTPQEALDQAQQEVEAELE
ncbi:ABC transporter substrate-binding protein [Sediminibacillus massiliensis]|uniref:ABC transporter substrate-binding protein n=1 Tax=Sediminibacillus massiliensis TaxID=1926277 RepID=UPI0009886CD0|nr:ABC transporter substrate-binding protein [Sediminibacillus massiliensis]